MSRDCRDVQTVDGVDVFAQAEVQAVSSSTSGVDPLAECRSEGSTLKCLMTGYLEARSHTFTTAGSRTALCRQRLSTAVLHVRHVPRRASNEALSSRTISSCRTKAGASVTAIASPV
jgi:hypothetical protein